MVVMGGKGTIVGAALGALIFTLLPEYLRIADEYRLVFFGGILIVAVLFFPRGMIEIFERIRNWAERPRQGSANA
jgi:branched-chain amino acid transport system permease protein